MTEGATIALTGGTGFLGRHIIHALTDAGHKVRALTRQPQLGDAPGVTWVEGGLEDKKALADMMKGADGAVHAAGAIKALNRDGFLAVNRDGTAAVADAAASAGVGRLVYISSLAAREPRLSPYAASKWAGELVLNAYRRRMAVAVLRPPAIYGPGDRETRRLFQMAANGFVLVPAAVNARMSLCHVADVAAAVCACLGADLYGQPFEIDDGRPGGHDWNSIVAAAGEAVSRKPRVLRLPGPVLYAAGALGTVGAAVTRRPSMLSLAKVPEILHADWVAAGPRPPGWRPVWSLKNGFKDAANWYASQNMLKSYL